MLVDDIGAQFLRFCRRTHTPNAIGTCWVIHGNEALPLAFKKSALRNTLVDQRYDGAPLLHCEGLILGDAETHHLSLSVEAIKVYVANHSERTGSVV